MTLIPNNGVNEFEMMVRLNTFDLITDRRKMLRMYKIEKGYLMGKNWLC